MLAVTTLGLHFSPVKPKMNEFRKHIKSASNPYCAYRSMAPFLRDLSNTPRLQLDPKIIHYYLNQKYGISIIIRERH